MRDYIVVDTETSGLDVLRDKIIELSWLKVIDGQAEVPRSYIVNPGEVTLTAEVSQIHGITQEMVDEGFPIREALAMFFGDIEKLPIVGHNIMNFDWPLITYTVMRDDPAAPSPLTLTPRLVDTMALYKGALMHLQQQPGQSHHTYARDVLDRRVKGLRYSLGHACRVYGIEPGEGRLHQAAFDVRATHMLFVALMNDGVPLSLDGTFQDGG